MQVDCHMHPLCSDGVYTVKEIVEMLLRRIDRFRNFCFKGGNPCQLRKCLAVM